MIQFIVKSTETKIQTHFTLGWGWGDMGPSERLPGLGQRSL